MATRSTIALEFADGTVGQVYCHWDGYLSNNGKILLNHYMDPFKLQKLVDLGDLSSLGPDIGEKHEFENPHDFRTQAYIDWQEEKSKVCTFYNRDRGEAGVEARYFKDFEDYKANHQYEEYEYILRKDGVWYVADHSEKYEPLLEAYIEELRERNDEEAEQELLAKFVDMMKV